MNGALLGRTTNLSSHPAEADFALVLARVIGSVEADPAQLRNIVYELARIKLRQEAWQQHPAMSARESRSLMSALEGAIDRVEMVALRYGELRVSQSLDRLIETSGALPRHSVRIEEPNSFLTLEQAPRAKSNTVTLSTLLRSATRDSPKEKPRRGWLGTWHLIGALFAVGVLAAYVIFDHRLGLFNSSATSPGESIAPPGQTRDVAPAAALLAGSPSVPLPVTYGVYAISNGRLFELEALPGKVPDPRVFMSSVIKRPSHTELPDGRVGFIVFRRDIAASAPNRVSVRVIAKIERTMTFSPTASVTPVDDEWAVRGVSYELRVEPVKENPEMLRVRPDDPDFAFSPGRYALVLRGQAFDFTVAGVALEAAHCLERTEAANGTFYSECRTQ